MAAKRSTVVRFAGARGGEAHLSWGQRSIWRSIRWLADDDPYFNVPWTLPIDGEYSLEWVTDALRTLIERHEALRTTCIETADEPVQRVAVTGSIVVEVHDAGEEDPATYAEQTAANLAATAFRYAEELPLRCAVICAGERPRRLALALSHLSIDAWSLGLLRDEWARLLRGETLPEVPRQPVDRARFEREGDGQRRGEESLAYWQRTLRAVPRSLFDFPSVTPEEPRFVRVGIESPALAVAADRVATAGGVSTATVLTVAVAAVLSAYTGHPECVMQLIVANRHDERYRAMVGPTAQDGLLALSFDRDSSLTNAVKRGHMQAMAAYRYGHYDPVRLALRRQEAARERGVSFDLSAFFNDIRPSGDWPRLPKVSGATALEALTQATTTRFVGAWSSVDAKAFFATGDAPHTGQLYLLADTAYVPRQRAYDLLRAVESLLVRAATDGDLSIGKVPDVCGLEPVTRPPDWLRIGPDWLSPGAVEEVVRGAVGAEHATVALERDAGREAQLTAFLVPPGDANPESVHEAVVAALAGRTDAIAPHRYVLCTEPPTLVADIGQWRACPRSGEGSGRRTR